MEPTFEIADSPRGKTKTEVRIERVGWPEGEENRKQSDDKQESRVVIKKLSCLSSDRIAGWRETKGKHRRAARLTREKRFGENEKSNLDPATPQTLDSEAG